MDWFIFALAAAVIAAFAAVVEKKTLFKEHATEFSTNLAIMNFLVVLPLIFWVNFNLTITLWVLLFFCALFATFGFLFVTKAVRHMEISAASPLLNLGPGFLAVLAFFILGEQLSPLQITGIITLIIGAYILQIDFRSHNIFTPFRKIYKSKYIHYIFIALFSYAISSIMGKYLLGFIAPLDLVFIEQFFIAIIFVAILLIEFDGFHGIANGMKRVGWWILLAAILTVSYRFLQATAMSLAFVSLVIPIKRLSTLFATIIGGEIFKEHGLYQKIAACIIMILGASLIILA